ATPGVATSSTPRQHSWRRVLRVGGERHATATDDGKTASSQAARNARGLEQQEQDAAVRELSFLDRLALLIDRQWTWRQNQILTRRLQASRLKGAACVENIDYRAERGLNRTVIRGLAQDSTWVKNHEHIFVLGPTGVGKSYVASALAQKACRDGYSVYYVRTAALFRDLNLARADGSLRQLLKRLNRTDVLLTHDWPDA